MLLKKDHAEAGHAFCKAIETAKQQGVRILELRAAISLARTTGGDQLCEELIDALAWFAPEQAAPELTAAREILAQ